MQDATAMAELLRAQKISFEELITDIETKSNQLQPKLNAWTYLDLSGAKKYYRKNQDKLSRTVFAGLPIALKALGQSKKGWPSTSGSLLLAENKAKVTDYFVQGIENLGFVPIGQSNVPEYGFKNITDSKLYGNCLNPFDTARFAGGSSGGAAALVASGILPIATASDGGGSIRIPASFCSLIGLKPTRGSMPVGPGNWRSWQGASIAFALTKSIRDTENVFYNLRTSQPEAPYQAPKREWMHYEKAVRYPLRIAYCLNNKVSDLDYRIRAETLKIVDFLQKEGFDVEEVPYPANMVTLMQQYYRMNAADTAAMFQEMQAKLKRPLTNQDMEEMTWAMYQFGLDLKASDYVLSLQYWDEIAVKTESLFKEYDLFLTPSTAQVAPSVDTEFYSPKIGEKLRFAHELSPKEKEKLVYDMFAKSLSITPYTQLANLTGQPAISLPTGRVNDLPVGVQFMASKGREDLLLMVGALLEQAKLFTIE
ncbi:amidase [Enterococcus cecorum]|uniref:amidase n=1 Tax=Enterococcus cecorum TaxID=44008 RepID=UPI0022D72AC9|nr:amidase [Enterococcus cecorum]CAI3409851.1 amidase [Enterococcus cecorum]